MAYAVESRLLVSLLKTSLQLSGLMWFFVSLVLIVAIIYLYRQQMASILDSWLQAMYAPPQTNSYNGTSTVGNYFTQRPQSMRNQFNEYLLAENDVLRARVSELERTIELQRNEMIVLQTTTADVIRRLARLEVNGPADRPSSIHSRPPTRSFSHSANISNSCSPDKPSLSRSMYSHRDKKSLSPARKANGNIVNVPLGKSVRGSPMRKWMSNADMKSPTKLQDSPSPSTSGASPSNVRTISRSSSRTYLLSATPKTSRWNLSHKRISTREPTTTDKTLQLQVGDRNVSVPLPEKYANLDLKEGQSAPEVKPKLQWAYGYRGKDVRHNLHYLPTDEIVYFTGAVVVLRNVLENTQRFYKGHTSDVRSIAVHPNRHLLASGQTARPALSKDSASGPILSSDQLEKIVNEQHLEAHVRIWDSVSLSTVSIIGGIDCGLEKSIAALSFSICDGGKLLAVVDESYQHNLSVWKWESAKKTIQSPAANDTVFGCLWHPTVKDLLVVYGKGHFAFWQYDAKSETLMKNIATFEGRDKPKSVICVCITPSGLIASGDSNGTLSLWSPETFKIVKQAFGVHKGGIFSMTSSDKADLVTVGKDRHVSRWDATDLIRKNRPLELPEDSGFPRSIMAVKDNVFIGTSANNLFCSRSNEAFKDLVQGDNDDITTISFMSSHNLLVTGSRDGSLRVWNIEDHSTEFHRSYADGIECLSTHDGLIAIAFSDGSWNILEYSTKETVTEYKECGQAVSCISFSPKGNLLFVASKELYTHIYRLDTNKRCHKITRIASLSSWVVSIDWSLDSSMLRANSAIGHFYLWTVNGDTVDVTSSPEVEWATTNCRVSFEAGCVTHSSPGVTVVSGSDDLLLVGKDNGSLRLYKSPIISTIAGYHEMSGHGFAVSAVRLHEKHLFSAGQSDASLFQWLTK